MTDKYILQGTTPVLEPNLYAWAQWFETAERHVAETWVTPDVRVSTVFLGLDHQWSDGPPLLWETMVFGAGMGEDCWRWSTYHDAKQGHERMVEQVRAALLLALGG